MDDLRGRITSDPAVCSGKPCIRGTRIPVHVVLDLLAADKALKGLVEFLRAHPNIRIGKPFTGGRRIRVGKPLLSVPFNPLAANEAFNKILRAYPNIERDDIRACLQYAAALAEEEAGVQRSPPPPARV